LIASGDNDLNGLLDCFKAFFQMIVCLEIPILIMHLLEMNVFCFWGRRTTI